MKIVQLCAIDQTMSVFLSELNRQLIKQNFRVLCICSAGPYSQKIRDDGFNLINIPIERKMDPISVAKSIYLLYKLFKNEKPDIVHVHTPIASVLGRVAAKLARVPIIIYTAHGFYFHEGMKPLKYKFWLNIEKYMAKYFTNFIFTQSQEDRDTAVNEGFIEESKALCIGNGVDVKGKFNPQNIVPDDIDRLYQELKLSKDDKIITFIGRLIEEKGILDLLEGFSKIRDGKVKLLVVGDIDQGCRDGETKRLIVEKYSKKKNIIFTGFRSDINNILYITDIYCLPSYREGMPRSIIEAMALECAVIATDIRGCREEVIDGKTGFLIGVKSPEQIKNKIKQLIKNTELLNKMKLEGKRQAIEQFDELKCVEKQISIIKKLYGEYIDKR